MTTYLSKQIKKNNSNKLNLVVEIQQLTKQYYSLVNELSSLFVSSDDIKSLQNEILLLEQVLKSKLIISSSMRGF